jgi:outer membrane protein OmpA-like peptidoglycan-associated protein
LSLADGKLSARGAVPTEWAAEAGKLARAIPGVNKFAADLGEGLRAKLEQEAVRFAPGARALSARESVLLSVVETIKLLDADAQQAGRDVLIRVVGQTDKSGTPESNLELSRARAEAVLAALAQSGLNLNQLRRTRLVAEGVGDGGTSALISEAHRRVSFKVEFTAAPHSSSKPVN